MPHSAYVGWQRRCLAEMMRLLRPDGAIFYNHKWRVQKGLLQDRQDIVAGFPVRQVIIWHRSGGINFNPGYFLPNYEVIYLIAKKDFTLAPKANALGSVWRISQKTGNPHPAPFPPDLVRNCLPAVEQGPVLDPVIGSGTTAGVAEACELWRRDRTSPRRSSAAHLKRKWPLVAMHFMSRRCWIGSVMSRFKSWGTGKAQ